MEKPKINHFQIAATVIPMLIAMIAGWYNMQQKIALLEQRLIDIDKIHARIDNLSEKMDEKNSRMWQAISNKQDKN